MEKKRRENRKRTGLAAILLSMMAGLAEICGCGAAHRNGDVDQPPYRLVHVEPCGEGLCVDVAGENLVLQKGVRLKADSVEKRDLSPAYAGDGIADEGDKRWSSSNDWEDTEHWLEVVFPEKTRIGCMRIFWERTNACAYSLETSEDGKDWEEAVSFQEAPEDKEQYILLDEPVMTRYLRLHVTDVRKKEEDLSLYYQNVSVLELEAYGPCDRLLIKKPQIGPGKDRTLQLPEVPEPYGLRFGGADRENLVDMDGSIGDTLSPVRAELGFILERDGTEWELPGMEVEIPGSEEAGAEDAKLPEGVSVAEWKGDGGQSELSRQIRLIMTGGGEKELERTAAVFAEELEEAGKNVVGMENGADPAPGPVTEIRLELLEYNGMEPSGSGLGEEGYEIRIGEKAVLIRADTPQGIRWGCVTLLELMDKTDGKLPRGQIRDYPRYRVRGFGIDVGRRPVSMELLRSIVRELSRNKMNTLQIHLNDNQIISQGAYDGTVEGARNLYAGFRLESEMKNAEGIGITSQDLYYTKEEFAQFIEEAWGHGVEVVPEIDTPAHSLALTRIFPEWGMSGDPESADCLDLSKEGAVQLGKDLWKEYLAPEGEEDPAPFAACRTLHLGMDEYFGDSGDYLSYLQELSGYVQSLAGDKQLRIWGSLSMMDGDISGISRQLQMHIWDTSWADPLEMYEEGFPIINSLSSSLYLIPGGGYDRLDLDFLEKEWEPHVFRTAEREWELPAWSERMLGACYMMWNDWAFLNGHEITEEGLYDRFSEPLPVIAGKLW